MLSRFLPVVVLASLATAASTDAAPKAPDRCRADQFERVTLTDTRVRVLEGDATLVVCDRRSGRRTEVFTVDEKYGSATVGVIAGRFLSASYSETMGCPFPGCGEPAVTTGATTVVVDAATGRRRVLTDGTLVTPRLRADGVTVWLTGANPQRTLHVWDRTGRRQLATGRIAKADVRIGGPAVRYRVDGQDRRAAVTGF